MKKLAIALMILLLLGAAFALAEDKPTVYTCGDYQYTLREDGTAEIHEYTGGDEVLIIPSELDGYTVTRIGDYAFHMEHALTTVTIPESVTSIGEDAFAGCDALTSIIVTPGSYAEQYCQDNGLPCSYPEA